MTILVWDGEQLVCDRLAIQGALKYDTCKAEYHNGHILSGVGDVAAIEAHKYWWKHQRAEVELYPHKLLEEVECHFIVISPTLGLLQFENSPFPIKRGFSVCAYGEGRDFAYGALAMGASAVEAVEVANKYCRSCGLGHEVFTIQTGGSHEREERSTIQDEQG